MSGCIGTGCKAEVMQRQIADLKAELAAARALLDHVLSCNDLHGWSGERASPLCDDIEAALTGEKK